MWNFQNFKFQNGLKITLNVQQCLGQETQETIARLTPHRKNDDQAKTIMIYYEFT